MRKVRIYYSDGAYSMVEVDDPNFVTLHIEDRLWAAYERHIEQAVLWYNLLQRMDNEQYAKEQEGKPKQD